MLCNSHVPCSFPYHVDVGILPLHRLCFPYPLPFHVIPFLSLHQISIFLAFPTLPHFFSPTGTETYFDEGTTGGSYDSESVEFRQIADSDSEMPIALAVLLKVHPAPIMTLTLSKHDSSAAS